MIEIGENLSKTIMVTALLLSLAVMAWRVRL